MTPLVNKQPFGTEGYRLVGAAMAVYNELGFGLSEEIYQEALERELFDQGIPFDSQRRLAVIYKGKPLQKTYIPDLIVHEEIIVELKAVKGLLPEHEAQLMNYLRITRKPVGYLINFGNPGVLDWKRYLLSEYLPNPQISADQ